jgi:hypothetical protein
MEMTPLDCPSCGRRNEPMGVAKDALQYRCRACGMVYYGPEECGEGLEPVEIEDTPVEGGGDWQTTSPGD